MTFLTSYSTRSIGWLVPLLVIDDMHPSVDYCAGPPAAFTATSMGTANPMPMKTSCSVGLVSPVTMPTTCPAPVQQRSARIAGVDGRVELDQASKRLVPAGRLGFTVQAGHDARTERSHETQRVAHREHFVADAQRRGAAYRRGHDEAWQLCRRQDRDVFCRVYVGEGGECLRAVREGDLNLRRAPR